MTQVDWLVQRDRNLQAAEYRDLERLRKELERAADAIRASKADTKH